MASTATDKVQTVTQSAEDKDKKTTGQHELPKASVSRSAGDWMTS